MTSVPAEWRATIVVRAPEASIASHLERALNPEAAREVPRSTAAVHRRPDGRVEIEISARDSGAMRAALNTYLGWVHLAVAAARVARVDRPASAAGDSAPRSA